MVPDFAGCFTTADNYVDLPTKTQETIELYFEGEDFEIPEPSDIADLRVTGEYEGSVWILLDIDVSKLDSKPMRLSVSLPSHVVSRMDKFASEHHLTRCALIVKATEKYINKM